MRAIRVSHGWQYAYDNDDNLVDVWVNVTAHNTGRRTVHIEYVGFETMVVGDRRLADEVGVPPENNVWVNQRFEIALNGETIEVAPDGPSVKIWTRLLPICSYGIDPTQSPIRAYVVSWPETYWWEEPPQPLLAQPSQVHRTMKQVGEAVAHLVVDQAEGTTRAGPPDRPGEVIGLQRLMMGGDVEHVDDLLPPEARPPPVSDRGTSPG